MQITSLSRLWQYAFSFNSSSLLYTDIMVPIGFEHKLNSSGLDFLIETANWDVLMQLRNYIDMYNQPYAEFRLRQKACSGYPFQALASMFYGKNNVEGVLSKGIGARCIFRDLGGLGDFVDNLTFLMGWDGLSRLIGQVYIEVPCVIISLFERTHLAGFLVSLDTSVQMQREGYQLNHLSLLMAVAEEDGVNDIQRGFVDINRIIKRGKEPYICMNWSSGFKDDSYRNLYSYTKRSPSWGFWESFKSGISESSLTIDITDYGNHNYRDNLRYLRLRRDKASHSRPKDIFDLISSARLVVTVDTFIAHVSIALGQRTLLVLPKAYDPRWSKIVERKNHSEFYNKTNVFIYDMYSNHRGQGEALAIIVKRMLGECAR